MNICPSCAATTRQTKAGKNRCGTQRLQCQHCRRDYTQVPQKKGYPPATRTLALKTLALKTLALKTLALKTFQRRFPKLKAHLIDFLPARN